jgi:hypothetical protein
LAAVAGLFVLGLFLIVQFMPESASIPEAPAPGALRERVDATPGAVARQSPVSTPAAPQLVALRLAAAGDGSWIAARRGSATGQLLWEGTLEAGELLRLRARTLWLRVGAAANLLPHVNGERVSIPERTTILLVTPGGVRVLATAPAPRAAPSPAQPVYTPVLAPSSSEGAGTTDDAPTRAPGASGPAPDAPPAGGSGPSPDPSPGQ